MNVKNQKGYANYIIVFILAVTLIAGGLVYLYKFNISHAGTVQVARIDTAHDGKFNITGCKYAVNDNTPKNYQIDLSASYTDPFNIKWGTNGIYSTFFVRNNYYDKDNSLVPGSWGNEYSSISQSSPLTEEGSKWSNNTTTKVKVLATSDSPALEIGISTSRFFSQPSLVNENSMQTISLNDVPDCRDNNSSGASNVSLSVNAQSGIYQSVVDKIIELQRGSRVIVSSSKINLSTKDGNLYVKPMIINYYSINYMVFSMSKISFIGDARSVASKMVVYPMFYSNNETTTAKLNNIGYLVDNNAQPTGSVVTN